MFEHGFRLADLAVDPRAGEVSGRGAREKLDPKVMDVLVLLARHAGQIVPREDLLRTLWPDTVVTDDALTRCIYELRRQLAHAGGDERYKAMLETHPKRGYRLNAEIAPLPPAPGIRSQRPSNRRAFALASVILVAGVLWFVASRFADESQPESPRPTAAAATNSVAVLPFVDMSAAQDQTYLADGVAEEILSQLAQIRGLRVIARTSSFIFREQRTDIREIAAKLNVSHVLEGSVRRSGNRVRISAQLIEASSNSHLWSKTYDRALGDLFAVQDEIAASVATALDTALGENERSPRDPVSAEAYALYLQGHFLYNRRAPGDVARSAKYYQDALATEPGYAPAWAALAGSYYVMADTGEMPWRIARAKQYEAAHKAVALDPRRAAGHIRLAQYYFEGGDLEAARKHFRTAETLDPSASESGGSDDSWMHLDGSFENAIEDERGKVARDPLSAVAHVNLGVVLLASGRLEEAKSEILKALELSPDMGPNIEVDIARILVLQRRYDEARTAALRLPEGGIRDHGLALLFDAPGRRAEADAALARLAERRDSGMMHYIRLAEAYAFRGMKEEAISTLQHFRNAIDPDDERAVSITWWLQHEMLLSPFLMPLQADPRWVALLTDPG